MSLNDVTAKDATLKNLAEDLGNFRVPRYTSYPSAPHFHKGIDADIYQKWLQELPANINLSLYLHIPFCEEMCYFCGCHTKITKHYKPIAEYSKQLIKEIKLAANNINQQEVAHIHFGGGSPTMLHGEDFSDLMQEIRNNFIIKADAEIAVEMDPRTLDAEKIAHYAACGVNRASLGVQDFDAKVQTAINRIQPYEMVKTCVDNLRKVGIDKLNIDLIYGLPLQTEENFLLTMEKVLSLNPNRLSLFGYAHVPWMKKHQTLIDETTLPNAEQRFALFNLASEFFCTHGYVAIGLDHFARADDDMSIAAQEQKLHRNFQGYTTDSANALLGFGVSAISALPQGYTQNTSNATEYKHSISENNLPIIRGICLSDEDRLRAAIIEELMCHLQVDLDKIAQKFERKAEHFNYELSALSKLAEKNYVTLNNNIISIPNNARVAMRVVAAVFDEYLRLSEGKHSKAI